MAGLYSNFERKPRDFYPTPIEAMYSLLPHLKESFNYFEPTAGNGAIIRHLLAARPGARCIGATDIEPLAPGIEQLDLLKETPVGLPMADVAITNLPWERKLLHPMIEAITEHCPLWTIIDSKWVNNESSAPYLKDLCVKVVPIGRVVWEPGTDTAGKVDASWFLFDRSHRGYARILPRMSRSKKTKWTKWLRDQEEALIAEARKLHLSAQGIPSIGPDHSTDPRQTDIEERFSA